MRIKLGPVDGGEYTWWGVPQTCQGQPNEYQSCSHIHDCANYKRSSDHDSVKDELDDGVHNDDDDDCNNGGDSDGKRSDTPEFLLGGGWEWKVPACTMNTPKNGAENQ